MTRCGRRFPALLHGAAIQVEVAARHDEGAEPGARAPGAAVRIDAGGAAHQGDHRVDIVDEPSRETAGTWRCDEQHYRLYERCGTRETVLIACP
jgi:hypothetical protein